MNKQITYQGWKRRDYEFYHENLLRICKQNGGQKNVIFLIIEPQIWSFSFIEGYI